MWECQNGDQDGEKMVEHGIFPSTKEASMENAITFDHGSSDDDAEHGLFPSAMESSDEAEHGIFPSAMVTNAAFKHMRVGSMFSTPNASKVEGKLPCSTSSTISPPKVNAIE